MNKDSVEEELCQLHRRNICRRGEEVGQLGKLVNHCEDSIKAVGSQGEYRDEVHGDCVPSLAGNLNRMEKP